MNVINTKLNNNNKQINCNMNNNINAAVCSGGTIVYISNIIYADSLDDLPAIGSDKSLYIVGNVLYRWDGKNYIQLDDAEIVIDTEMSDTSENAVQNKVIKAYADTKQSKLSQEQLDNIAAVVNKANQSDLITEIENRKQGDIDTLNSAKIYADTKVEKTNTANRIYGTGADGKQKFFRYTSGADESGTIVARTTGARIKTTNAIENDECVNLGQADGRYVKHLTGTGYGAPRIYAISDDGKDNSYFLRYNPAKNGIPGYSKNQTLKTNTPVDNNDCANKQYVDNLVSAIPKFAIKVVDTLPTENISSTTVYLLKVENSQEPDLYQEWIYVNNTWEKLGTQKLELDQYAKLTAITITDEQLDAMANL